MAGSLSLLPLTAVSDTVFDLPVTLDLCSGLRTLWGGCGLGAAVLAAERSTGRDCAWATVQYLRPIHPDSVLRLTVTSRDGRNVSQAQVTGTVDGEQVVAGLAALGGGGPVDAQFVRPPEDVWARMVEPVPAGRAVLAMLADLAPSAISEALGEQAGGVSLDNTVRYARSTGAATEGGWVLVDLTCEAVVGDVAQLSGRLFDPSGALLAVCEQSAVVRRRAVPRTRA